MDILCNPNLPVSILRKIISDFDQQTILFLNSCWHENKTFDNIPNLKSKVSQNFMPLILQKYKEIENTCITNLITYINRHCFSYDFIMHYLIHLPQFKAFHFNNQFLKEYLCNFLHHIANPEGSMFHYVAVHFEIGKFNLILPGSIKHSKNYAMFSYNFNKNVPDEDKDRAVINLCNLGKLCLDHFKKNIRDFNLRFFKVEDLEFISPELEDSFRCANDNLNNGRSSHDLEHEQSENLSQDNENNSVSEAARQTSFQLYIEREQFHYNIASCPGTEAFQIFSSEENRSLESTKLLCMYSDQNLGELLCQLDVHRDYSIYGLEYNATPIRDTPYGASFRSNNNGSDADIEDHYPPYVINYEFLKRALKQNSGKYKNLTLSFWDIDRDMYDSDKLNALTLNDEDMVENLKYYEEEVMKHQFFIRALKGLTIVEDIRLYGFNLDFNCMYETIMSDRNSYKSIMTCAGEMSVVNGKIKCSIYENDHQG